MKIEQRLNELEARVAHQDHSILKLSDEIFQQQKQITLLEERARQLLERLNSMMSAAPAGGPSDEIPPHY